MGFRRWEVQMFDREDQMEAGPSLGALTERAPLHGALGTPVVCTEKSTCVPRLPKAKAPSASDRHPPPLCVPVEPPGFCGEPQRSQIVVSRGEAGPRMYF